MRSALLYDVRSMRNVQSAARLIRALRLSVPVVAHEEGGKHDAVGKADLDAAEPVIALRVDSDHHAARPERVPDAVADLEGAYHAAHRAPDASPGDEISQGLQRGGQESRFRGRCWDWNAIGAVGLTVVPLH